MLLVHTHAGGCCERAPAHRRLRRLTQIRATAESSTLNEPPKAMVVGSGVAGLAAALALTKAGWSVTCLERARLGTETTTSNAATAIHLWPGAMRALASISTQLADKVEAAGDIVESVALCRPDGRLVSSSESHAALPVLTIRQTVLQKLLLNALPTDTVVYDASLRNFKCHPHGEQPGPVFAIFESVSPFERKGFVADLLVGADGWQSQTRVLLAGPAGHASAAVDAGASVFRGILDARHAPPDLCPAGTILLFASPDGRTLTVSGCGVGNPTQLHGGHIFWTAAAACPPSPLAVDTHLVTDFAEPATADGRRAASLAAHALDPRLSQIDAAAEDTVQTRLRAIFPEFALLPQLLDATQPGKVVERRLFSRSVEDDAADLLGPSGKCGADGCVTLVGDAAHLILPSIGYGACLAIEAAADLGDAMRRATGSVGSSVGSVGSVGADAHAAARRQAAVAAALRAFEAAQTERAARAAEVGGAAADAIASDGGGGGGGGGGAGAVPASGPALQGWLLGNARRGGASRTASVG